VAFFRNYRVNLLNLHYGIRSIALSGGGAFFLAYLIKAGVPPPGVLAALAAILFGRFLMRPAVIPLGARLGMRALVVVGTILSALQYPVIAEVHGIGLALLAFVLVGALADSIYWSSYHAYFAALGDAELRGQQVAIREAIAAIIGTISPIVGGGLLVAFGARVAFGAIAAVAGLAALPILFTPDVPIARRAPGAFRAAIPGMLLFACDGWVCAGYYSLWQMALFLTLGEDFLVYGGALAIAAVAGAAGGMLLGRHIDTGNGVRAVALAFAGLFFAIALRAAALGYPILAVLANAIGSVEACLYIPTMMTAVYNQAKRSPCTLRFHVVTEGGWDIGGAAGCLLCALLIWSGISMSVAILTSAAGAAVSFVLLRRYYALNPVAPLHTGPAELALAQQPPI
jgi:MFS family permease